MSPLHSFLAIAQSLAVKPFDFWPPAEQTKLLTNTATAIKKLTDTLETKKLTDTLAFKHLQTLEKTVLPTELKEVSFIQTLNNLVDVYKHAPAPDTKTATLISDLEKAVSRAKPKILEHRLSLEHLIEREKKLTPEAKNKSDEETIKKIGIFYVLEYTLQVLFEFTRLSDTDKVKLLKDGLQTPAGNLPAYYPLEETFRKELCYKIFDTTLRHSLLEAFYKFEEVFYSEDMAKVGLGLKQFNLDVLAAFEAKGLKIFKGMVYTPFGNNIPIETLIITIANLKF